MNVPLPILVVFLAAWLGLQGWALAAINKLQRQMAALKAALQIHIEKTSDTEQFLRHHFAKR